jgi:hypothetical protein
MEVIDMFEPKVSSEIVVATPQVATPQVATPQVAAPQVAAPQVATPQVAAPQVATPTSTVLTNHKSSDIITTIYEYGKEHLDYVIFFCVVCGIISYVIYTYVAKEGFGNIIGTTNIDCKDIEFR